MASVDLRIERAGGLVHQDDLGRGRQRAGQAEALLLADRELQRGLAAGGPSPRPRGRLRAAPARPPRATLGAGGGADGGHRRYVLEMLFGKTTGCWKSMPTRRAARRRRCRRDRSIGRGRARRPRREVRRQVDQPVQAAQQRALAGAGRADDAEDLPRAATLEVDVAQDRSPAGVTVSAAGLENAAERWRRATWRSDGAGRRSVPRVSAMTRLLVDAQAHRQGEQAEHSTSASSTSAAPQTLAPTADRTSPGPG